MRKKCQFKKIMQQYFCQNTLRKNKKKRKIKNIILQKNVPCLGNFKKMKYATAPAYPLKKAVAAKAVVQTS